MRSNFVRMNAIANLEEKGLTKECRICKEILAATKENFYTGNGKLGFGSYCKVCDKKKRQERRQRRASQ